MKESWPELPALLSLFAAGLFATWLFATRRASTWRASTTVLHGSLALFFVQLSVAVLVVFFKELRPAGAHHGLALFFIQLAIAIFVELLKDLLGDLPGTSTARAGATAFSFWTLIALGAGRTLFLTLIFISKGAQGSCSKDSHH